MIEEIKTYRITCDDCEHSVQVSDVQCSMPGGWKQEWSTETDMFYRTVKIFCPVCANRRDREDQE